ncbi:site-specific integrase [Paraburkholderia sp. BL10I2N1]|uniref:tyrosine-type recombinase/integrase n=1 Tax=Paraburkholderia sp. BL10I2N1 TaxID=1938796 RepID=UPI0010621268|nr:site-specific integrase [Paraburkholderia sp. BL10I2N1]
MLKDAAEEWDWIHEAPSLLDLPEAKKRVRWITQLEAQRLLACMTPMWMREVTELAFNTGLRWSNAAKLEWAQVDLVRKCAWIHPDQAKAKKPIGVPLNPAAVEVIRRQIGKHGQFVFTTRGHGLARLDNRLWKIACARTGLTDFRFHDTRHTWATWHVQNGTPLNVLMELGGWASYEMVLRYVHLAPDHLAEHANAVTLWSQAGLSESANGLKSVG